MFQIRGYHDRLLRLLRCLDFVLPRAHGVAAEYTQGSESSSAAGYETALDCLSVARSTFEGIGLVSMREAVHLMTHEVSQSVVYLDLQSRVGLKSSFRSAVSVLIPDSQRWYFTITKS